jgi:hypothetical protein
MQRAHKRFHLGVFGGSGSGKSTYAMKFVANAPAKCVFLFDPEGEFSDCMNLQPARTTYELDQAIRSGWVCFDPHTMFPGELEKALEYFTQLALTAAKLIPGRKFFVIDELGNYVTGSTVPKPLKILAQTGRRYGVDCVFIGQQPNHIHNAIRCQLTEVICFQLTEDCALEFPKKFGFDVEAIRALQPFQFIARNNRGGELRYTPGTLAKAGAKAGTLAKAGAEDRRQSAPEPARLQEPGPSQSGESLPEKGEI